MNSQVTYGLVVEQLVVYKLVVDIADIDFLVGYYQMYNLMDIAAEIVAVALFDFLIVHTFGKKIQKNFLYYFRINITFLLLLIA